MQTLTVDLGDRSYPIHIGAGLLNRADLILPHLAQKRVVVVTNTTVAPLYLAQLTATLESGGVKVAQVVLPDGEAYKNWETLNLIFDALLTDRAERKTTLIALGGGVIGDMTGFAAASYQRGVPFIQIPTTLLSQVDSSVGGKTGINHPLGKNMIGAFYQPKAGAGRYRHAEDPAAARTVGRAGRSHQIWPDLGRGISRLAGSQHGAAARARPGGDHPCDRPLVRNQGAGGGRRTSAKAASAPLLNLGHTFGHAIETGMGYGNWLHGEAVAAGMVMAAQTSQRIGWLTAADVARTRALIRARRAAGRGAGPGRRHAISNSWATTRRSRAGKCASCC